MAGRKPQRKIKRINLPEKRIRTIMKSSPEVENISQEALFLVNKATEMFVHYLTISAYSVSKDEHILEYNNLAELVQTHDILSFLREIMPRKITFRECKEILAAQGREIPYEDEDSDSDLDDEDESVDENYSTVYIKEEILSDSHEEECYDEEQEAQSQKKCESTDSKDER